MDTKFKINKIMDLLDQGKLVGIVAGQKNGEWEQYSVMRLNNGLYELKFTPAYKTIELNEVQYRKIGDFNNTDIQIELYKIDVESDIERLIIGH